MDCVGCNGCFYPSDHGVVVAVDGQIPKHGRTIFRNGKGCCSGSKNCSQP